MNDLTFILAVKLTAAAKNKVRALGGARWVRAQIEAAPEAVKPVWQTREERNKLILADLRPAKVVGYAYGLSPATVRNIRAYATRKRLKESSCPSSPPRSSSET